jgi:hypothetical protein
MINKSSNRETEMNKVREAKGKALARMRTIVLRARGAQKEE